MVKQSTKPLSRSEYKAHCWIKWSCWRRTALTNGLQTSSLSSLCIWHQNAGSSCLNRSDHCWWEVTTAVKGQQASLFHRCFPVLYQRLFELTCCYTLYTVHSVLRLTFCWEVNFYHQFSGNIHLLRAWIDYS